ncbi:MAG: DUF4115 domain-containing protein [Nitrincola sp.]|nr:DUF4115 domain-containing protein [Nitrincola sp.]
MSVDDQQDVQAARFPGHDFTQARENLHLSLEQVSTELHLPIKVIKAIESGNPQSFHNPVFIRGYIRTYAKHLGLDAAYYANIYASLPGVDLQPVTIKSTTSVKERDPSKSPFMKIFSWLFVLAIIAVIIWWSREQSGRSILPSTDTSQSSLASQSTEDVFDPTPLPLIVAESDGVDVFDGSDPELASDVGDNESADSEIISVEMDQDSGVDTTSEPVNQVDSALFMRFNGDCWVQVRDANDALLYSGVATNGTELQLEGDLPLSLVIGRRDAVAEIRFKGELIDLGSFTTGNVARFSLPLRQ